MMVERRSLKWPIILAVVMIVLLIVLIVGWVVLTWPAQTGERAALYWTALAVGTTFLLLVLVGVVLYLALSIKAINLTRQQSNFIDSVTHELKSPIASLKLYLQTLSRRQVSPDEQQDFCRFMLEDVDRLDHLINHVLEAGQVQKERALAQREQVPLEALLAECAKTVCLRYRVPQETVTLKVQPCVVLAARMDVDMIFRNLLDNAVKYAATNPKVTATAWPTDEGMTVVRVADNGRGIPAKLRRKIFGRFVRLGLELERSKPGTGLGLYIVRTLVKRWGGRVRVVEADGATGTVFEVRLPGGPDPTTSVDAETPTHDSKLGVG